MFEESLWIPLLVLALGALLLLLAVRIPTGRRSGDPTTPPPDPVGPRAANLSRHRDSTSVRYEPRPPGARPPRPSDTWGTPALRLTSPDPGAGGGLYHPPPVIAVDWAPPPAETLSGSCESAASAPAASWSAEPAPSASASASCDSGGWSSSDGASASAGSSE